MCVCELRSRIREGEELKGENSFRSNESKHSIDLSEILIITHIHPQTHTHT